MLPPQASKDDLEQPRLADVLRPFDAAAGVADAVVVGCGPAGLALAAELASRGVQVALIGAQLVVYRIDRVRVDPGIPQLVPSASLCAFAGRAAI